MKRYSTPLAIREIKITVRYHYTPTGQLKRMTAPRADEAVETVDHADTAAGSTKWCSHPGKPLGSFFEPNRHLPYKPEIALLGQRNENLRACRNLHMNIHSSSINSQKLGTTQMSFNW